MVYIWSCVWECDNTPIQLYGMFRMEYSRAVLLKAWFANKGVRMVCVSEEQEEVTQRIA